MSNKPLSVDQTLIKAKSLAKKDSPDQAMQLYQAVLKRFPRNKRAIEGLNLLERPKPNQEQIVLNKAPTQEQINGLIALYNQGQLQEALDQGTALYEQYPNVPLILNILGAVNAGLGRLDQAVASYSKALQIKPDYAEAHSNLGNALSDFGKHEEAIASLNKALQLKPDFAEAHYNLGKALNNLGKHEESIASYTKSLQIKPDFAKAHNNLGVALRALGKHEEAIASYTKALLIKPEYAEAHNNLGNVLKNLGKHEEAIASYSKALQIKPDYAEAKSQKRHQQAYICDWVSLESEGSAFASSLATLGTTGTAVSPLSLLSFEDHPERNRKRAKSFAEKKYTRTALLEFERSQVKPSRIRIGYFSADF